MSDGTVYVLIFILFIILLIPTFIQFKYGVRVLSGWTNLKFWQLTLLCFFGELLLSISLFFIVAFVESTFRSVIEPPHCGLGFAGIAVFGIPISFLNVIIAFIQKISIKYS